MRKLLVALIIALALAAPAAATVRNMPPPEGGPSCYYNFHYYAAGYYHNIARGYAAIALVAYEYPGYPVAQQWTKVWFWCEVRNGSPTWFAWGGSPHYDPGYGAYDASYQTGPYWTGYYCVWPYIRHDGDNLTFGPSC